MLLLPKIVVKSPEIDGSISRFKDELLDEADITKLWKTFTTIKRSIVDPNFQASRLENFWWRVLGSKQKYLPCFQLGYLISRISDETFDASICSSTVPDRTSLTQSIDTPVSEDSIKETGQEITVEENYSNKPITADFIPHPILKKTGITSSQGPKPTARFISPNETKGNNTIAHHVPEIVSQPASIGHGETKSEKRRVLGPKRKGPFLTIKKKQPVIIRRQGPNLGAEGPKKVVGAVRSGTADLSVYSDRTSLSAKQAVAKSNNQFPHEKFRGIKLDARDSSNSQKSRLSLIANEIVQIKHPKTVLDNESKNPGSFMQEIKVLTEINDVSLDLSEVKLRVDINDPTSEDKPKLFFQTLLEKTELISSIEPQVLLGVSHTKSKHELITPHKRESQEELSLPLLKDNFALNDENKVDSSPTHSVLKSGIDEIDEKTSICSRVVTNAINSLDTSVESKSCSEQISVNIFAKRPIQSLLTSSKSTEKLIRNKSQLTLLIEGDRAKIADGSLQRES